jgi:hypothetical protein
MTLRPTASAAVPAHGERARAEIQPQPQHVALLPALEPQVGPLAPVVDAAVGQPAWPRARPPSLFRRDVSERAQRYTRSRLLLSRFR